MAAVQNRSRGRRNRLVNEINVVPYIDVMLVLLVIFMVTAPFVPTAQIDLPTVGSSQARPEAFVEVIVEQAGAMTLRTHNLPQRMERKATREQLINVLPRWSAATPHCRSSSAATARCATRRSWTSWTC